MFQSVNFSKPLLLYSVMWCVFLLCHVFVYSVTLSSSIMLGPITPWLEYTECGLVFHQWQYYFTFPYDAWVYNSHFSVMCDFQHNGNPRCTNPKHGFYSVLYLLWVICAPQRYLSRSGCSFCACNSEKHGFDYLV